MNWYATYTLSKHEQKVNDRLGRKKIETFLPLIERWSRRKDRRKKIYLPLFPGYLFVHTEMDPLTYLEILKTDSVVRLLCHDGKPASIPDEQIHVIKILIRNRMAVTPCTYLREGMRVRVVNGPLNGVEGIFIKTKPNKHRLVLSLDLLQESVCVEIDELDVEPIHLHGS